MTKLYNIKIYREVYRDRDFNDFEIPNPINNDFNEHENLRRQLPVPLEVEDIYDVVSWNWNKYEDGTALNFTIEMAGGIKLLRYIQSNNRIDIIPQQGYSSGS